MKYDNEKDRNEYGYDAGNIVDGIVQLDPDTKEYVLVDDDDGVGFSTQNVLKSLEGKKVRVTIISFEAIEAMEKLLAKSQ